MNKKSFRAVTAILSALVGLLAAQDNSVIIKIEKGQKPKVAVPDFRGSGAAQSFMGAFNETLFNDLNSAGLFEMVAKGMYPLQVRKRPGVFRQPPSPGAPAG